MSLLSAALEYNDIVITRGSGNGKELYALRPDPPSLRIHSLGGVTPMAIGMALALPDRRVVALDTDGGMCMNLGALLVLGEQKPDNLTVLIMDDSNYGSLDASAGRWATATARSADLAQMARGAGLEDAVTVTTAEEFEARIHPALRQRGASLTVMKAEIPAADVPSPPEDSLENRYQFIRYVEKTQNIRILRAAL
jgi:thiamine pyrophosphate-dependent acetolactate synthase large subunit-like protein